MSQIGLVVFGLKGSGKSTLCGNILSQYRADVDYKTLQKAKAATKQFNKENSEYAFLCDKEEPDRKNGTQKSHVLNFSMSNQKYMLIDTCTNSLKCYGFCKSQIGILILEAYKDENKFNSLINNKSDTYNQLTIAHSFGIQQIIICINKIDKNDLEFNEQLYNKYTAKIQTMIKSIGYNENKVPIIPICSYSALNLFKVSEDNIFSWWKQKCFHIKSISNQAKMHKIKTLMQAIKYVSKKINMSKKSKTSLLCMPITSQTKMENIGTVYSSTIFAGQIKSNQHVLCCKSGQNSSVKKYKINSLQTQNKNVKVAFVGDNINFTLENDEKDAPHVGDVICNPNEFKMSVVENNEDEIDYTQALPQGVNFSDTFVALIIMLNEDIVNKQTLKTNSNAFNINLMFKTQTLNCSLNRILKKYKRKDNNLNNPLEEKCGYHELSNGDECEVVFSSTNKHFLTKYTSVVKAYSRFVIMKEKIVIGIGKIIAVTNKNDFKFDDILPDGLYKFETVHSGKYIDVKEVSMDRGKMLHQWEWLDADNQKFYIKKQENGYYTVQCKHSQLYWDIEGGSGADHAKLIQWTYHGGENQLFEIGHVKDGKYGIKAKHSGKSLDISGGAKGNGGEIIQYTTHNGDNQLFFCIKLE